MESGFLPVTFRRVTAFDQRMDLKRIIMKENVTEQTPHLKMEGQGS